MLFECRKILYSLPLLLLSNFSFAGIIKGKVVDSSNGNPLVGATVKLKHTKYHVVVKADGTFSLQDIPVGSYTLVVVYTGYQIPSQNITIKSNDDVQTFALKAQSIVPNITSIATSDFLLKRSNKGI